MAMGDFMMGGPTSCSNCGNQGAALLRCSACKQTRYCGAECQKAAWKRHKITCAFRLPLADVRQKVLALRGTSEWRMVLKSECRLAELMDDASENPHRDDRDVIL